MTYRRSTALLQNILTSICFLKNNLIPARPNQYFNANNIAKNIFILPIAKYHLTI
jgi:hypothetical protein